ncbi:conserved hypothetical protein [Xenorhabdus nematophila str. Anatoliense]|nr:conserved hypothetical protein [Xenorhabdus nematophila str. Anatoliense]
MLRMPLPQTFPPETLSLDDLVPKNHLVRKVDAALDFEFIRDLVAPLYCHNNGRPAIDPVMLIKMMLLGYLFGVPSERESMKNCGVFMLPLHSALSLHGLCGVEVSHDYACLLIVSLW